MSVIALLVLVGIAFVLQQLLINKLWKDLHKEIKIRHDEVDGLMNCIRALLEAQKLTTDSMGKISKVIK